MQEPPPILRRTVCFAMQLEKEIPRIMAVKPTPPESLSQALYTSFPQSNTNQTSQHFIGNSISSVPTVLLARGCIDNLAGG